MSSLSDTMKLVDKNSRAMTKVMQLQELHGTMRRQDAGEICSYGVGELIYSNTNATGACMLDNPGLRAILLRIERLKARVHRRLVRLAQWVDTPTAKRLPPSELPLSLRSRREGSLRVIPPGRSIFIPDRNVQRGSIVPGAAKQGPLRIDRAGGDFRPGGSNAFKQAEDIVSLQKKVIQDAISGITAAAKKDVALVATAEPINVSLPAAQIRPSPQTH